MKKMILILLMFAIVECAPSFASAAGGDRMSVVRAGEIFKVIYKGHDLVNVKIAITDLDGNKVFAEELISVHGFVRPYNFSQLPKGDYLVCVTDDVGMNTEKISYEEQVANDHTKNWTAHLSRLNTGKNKVLVAIPQQQSNDFTIKIYNHNDDLIYMENHSQRIDFAKIYHLKNFEGGAVFHVTNNSSGETKIYRSE